MQAHLDQGKGLGNRIRGRRIQGKHLRMVHFGHRQGIHQGLLRTLGQAVSCAARNLLFIGHYNTKAGLNRQSEPILENHPGHDEFL